MLANKIMYTTLQDVVKTVEIYYDPDPINNTTIAQDRPFIASYVKNTLFQERIPKTGYMKWILRYELDREKMVLKQMRMSYIRNRIREFNNQFYPMETDDNSDKLIIRVHIISDTPEKNEKEQIFRFRDVILRDIALKGVSGIMNAQHEKVSRSRYDPKTGDIVNVQEYQIYTVGSNLQDILGFDGIDSARVRSNDIVETKEILGISSSEMYAV